jgi:hypothetical protein
MQFFSKIIHPGLTLTTGSSGWCHIAQIFRQAPWGSYGCGSGTKRAAPERQRIPPNQRHDEGGLNPRGMKLHSRYKAQRCQSDYLATWPQCSFCEGSTTPKARQHGRYHVVCFRFSRRRVFRHGENMITHPDRKLAAETIRPEIIMSPDCLALLRRTIHSLYEQHLTYKSPPCMGNSREECCQDAITTRKGVD